jgi:tetratricopeptide (TPR) repeat protein
LSGLVCFLVFMFPAVLVTADDLSQADQFYKQGGMENFKRAIELYQKVLETNPDNYEANWKCARAYRQYGDKAKKTRVEGWKDICAEYGKEGMKYGLKAIELEPLKPEGHYYYGLCVGVYSDGVSVLTALSEGLKGKTQESFEKTYELDKMFHDAGPILSLGRFWSVLPWPFKDKKKALRYYREYQATPYFADNDEAKLFLAELLLNIGGEENEREAKTLLKTAAQSKDAYFRDWANRLLTQNQE